MGGLIEIRTLQNVSMRSMHRAFLKVFADYEVPMQMSVVDLEEIIRTRDIDLNFSIGCFVRKELIGFILCGYRDCEGKRYAYDGGTGIVKEYRRKGFADRMFSELLKIFENKKIDIFILEVLENNTSAIELYRKNGFIQHRKLRCFEIEKDSLKELSAKGIYSFGYNKSEYHSINLQEYVSFRPTWQNCKYSVLNNIHMYEYVSVCNEDKVIGFGLIHKNKGDIPLLGVLEEWRNKGIELEIILQLETKTKSNTLCFKNVEDDNYIVDILREMGFVNFVNQYEMALDFSSKS